MLTAISCLVMLAACGSSGSHKPSGSAGEAAGIKFADCMRAHGVPNFPDPTKGPGGEGISITMSPGSATLTVGGIPFSGPAFQAAKERCKLFGGGSRPPAVSESQKLAEFHFAQCMRKHGVPSFPDPVFPAGGGIERPDVPGLSRDSPAVKHAASVCNRA